MRTVLAIKQYQNLQFGVYHRAMTALRIDRVLWRSRHFSQRKNRTGVATLPSDPAGLWADLPRKLYPPPGRHAASGVLPLRQKLSVISPQRAQSCPNTVLDYRVLTVKLTFERLV
jgi:hypothetical protein